MVYTLQRENKTSFYVNCHQNLKETLFFPCPDFELLH